jgi:uncharacterized protein YaiE (UPF0345 family)
MNLNNTPEFIKLEMHSIPPLSWTIEFKRDKNEISTPYRTVVFRHAIGMAVGEAYYGHASEEHVKALYTALESIRQHPQSGNWRVIADGSQIEVRTPSNRFQFFTSEEGENGKAFLCCLHLVCSGFLELSVRDCMFASGR